ncbi:MAG: hypothetical protein M1833_001367 [Piccolia ochrophora]|nr:MAG: hypothetical protein M1833_001367 [Piccolia ochrophora]
MDSESRPVSGDDVEVLLKTTGSLYILANASLNLAKKVSATTVDLQGHASVDSLRTMANIVTDLHSMITFDVNKDLAEKCEGRWDEPVDEYFKRTRLRYHVALGGRFEDFDALNKPSDDRDYDTSEKDESRKPVSTEPPALRGENTCSLCKELQLTRHT